MGSLSYAAKRKKGIKINDSFAWGEGREKEGGESSLFLLGLERAGQQGGFIHSEHR